MNAPVASLPLAGAEPQISRREFLNLLASVFLPMFVASLDQTLLATATPAIAATLGGLRDTSWIAVAYLLASATVVPVYGRLGDARGRRDVLLAALAIFTVGSLACGFAQTLPQLVAGRVVQGLGGGGLMTLSQALIGEIAGPRARVRYQGYFAAMFAASSVGGPVLGGVVVSHLDWRWLFYANAPLAALAAWRLCRLPRGQRHPRNGPRDPAGLALFATATVSLLYWFTSVGHHFTLASPSSVALVATALAAGVLLALRELGHPSPFLPVDLLRRPAIAFSVATTGFFAACMFSLVFYVPIYLQLAHRFGAMASGLLLLPLTAGIVIGSTTTSRVLRRTGLPKRIPVYGMSLTCAALLLLAVMPANVWMVMAVEVVAGAGLGTVMPVNQLVLQTLAGRERLGAVTAMNSLSRSLGAAAGAALFGAVIYAFLPEVDLRTLVRSGDAGVPVFQHAFHRAFLFAAAVAALAAFFASRVPAITLWTNKKTGDAPRF